jgi:VWFA-related protein
MKRSCFLITLLALTSLASSVEAKPFGETLEVRIINVDVVVTDKAGNPIPGLTADDFEIFENGRRQPVTNFAEYREAAPLLSGDEKPEELPITVATKPPEKRRLLFFIDRLQLVETANREDFFRGLRAFVEETMREGDEAAIYFFGTSLHTLVAMTPDRSAILEAIATIESESRLRTDQEAMELAEIGARARMYASDAAAGVPGGGAMEELDRRQAAQRAYDEQRRKTLAINTVIQAAAGLEGRKVMILVTHRFSKLPGLEYDYPATEFNARKMMDAVVDNANAAGVTIYGLYPQGLLKDEVSTRSYELLMNRAETIESIATRTGGIAALGGKLSAETLVRTTQHLTNYYSLAYRAPDNRNGRERKVRVEVKREGVKVLARNAVIDKSDEEVARDRLVAATLFGESESAIRISAKQNGGRKSGLTTWTIPVEITIPIAQMTALPTEDGYEGRFRVMAAAANGEGDVSEVVEKEQVFKIPANDIEKARAGFFTYVLEIKVRDTSDRAVVAVWDEIDQESGYAEVALDLGKATSPNVAPGRQGPMGRNPRGSGRSGTWPH